MVDLPPIAVMDGECTLCSFGARVVHLLDRSGDIRICKIQTEMGRNLLRQNGLNALDPESWLFIEGSVVYRDFDALIRVGERSGGIGHTIRLLRILPSGLRNSLYRWIARNRYRLFGRKQMCDIPDPALQRRMIS